jgi:hypothetical protein
MFTLNPEPMAVDIIPLHPFSTCPLLQHFIWLEVLVQLSLSTAKLTTHSELLHNLFNFFKNL